MKTLDKNQLNKIALYLSGEHYGYYDVYYPITAFVEIVKSRSDGLMTDEIFDMIQKFTKNHQEFYYETLYLLQLRGICLEPEIINILNISYSIYSIK